MSARPDALRDDEIAPGLCGGKRFFPRAHLPGRQRSVVVDDPYEFWVRVGVEELDRPGRARRLLDELAWRPSRDAPRAHDEVDSEGTGGELSRPVEHSSEGSCVQAAACRSQHAERAGFGDRSRQLRRRGRSHAACWIGAVHPTSFVNRVVSIVAPFCFGTTVCGKTSGPDRESAKGRTICRRTAIRRHRERRRRGVPGLTQRR